MSSIKNRNKKLIRITTVPQSLRGLLRGQLRFMSENGFNVIGVSSPGQALEDVKDNECVRIEAIEMTRAISPLMDLKALWQLYKFFIKEKPLIVHTHTPKAGTLGMIAAWLARVPIRLHTVAGLPLMEVKGKKRKLLDFVEKATYKCANRIYPNSKGLYDYVLKHGYTTADKLTVIGKGSSNGIDTKYFDPKEVLDGQREELIRSLGITQDIFVFLFVGRMVKEKGIDELIEAFDILSQKYDNVKLILVGGIHHNDPISSASELNIKINSSIITVGKQIDVRKFYAIADVFVFPSYREGFPNVVMEASAMELPSVVTDINGCNEIIADGFNGLVIPVKNSFKLESAMEKLLLDKSLFLKLKSNTRTKVQSDYERKFVWEELLKAYNEITNKYD